MKHQPIFPRNNMLMLVVLLVILLVSPIFLILILQQMFSPDLQLPPVTIHREITASTPGFELIWQKSPVYSIYGGSKGSIQLVAIEDSGYFLGNMDEIRRGTLSLSKFSLATGEIIWNIFKPPSMSQGYASTLGANNSYVYVGSSGTQKISGETEWGASHITAYDLSEGQLEWQQVIGGARSIEVMVVTDSIISVNGSFSSNYYWLDATSGEIVDTRPIDSSDFMWFADNGVRYEEAAASSFQAVDETTGTVLWSSPFHYGIYQPPFLTPPFIVGRAGEARFLGTAFAVDVTTGDLLWTYPNLISNVAIGESIAFFLNEQATLVAVDIQTGDLVGEVNFSPRIEDSINNSFQVATNGTVVLVYFSDSRELFAFEFSEK